MIKSINSMDSKKQTVVKTTAGAAAGATIGAGTAYLLQSRAIKKGKAAQEAATKTGIKKWLSQGWETIKGWAKSAKTKYAETMKEIVANGKVSKMGIAKVAGVGALVVGSIVLAKSLMANKKED